MKQENKHKPRPGDLTAEQYSPRRDARQHQGANQHAILIYPSE